jgi:hypothetical protein
MKEENWDEIELADGKTTLIPQQDQVRPTFGNFQANVGMQVEHGRVRMGESGRCVAKVAAPVRSIDEPVNYASIYAAISSGVDDDDVWAEISFPNAEQVRRLRDTLDLILRYWGDKYE